jgi:Spy/CpxP family protein refolding chaperone
MLAKTLVAVILLAGVAAAQDPVRPGGPFVPPYSDLRQYLSLTDVQVRSLEQVQTNRREAESAIYRQTADKQRTLSGLLQAGSTDALQIGQLMVEINNLQRRMPLAAEPYRSAALAVLTEAQKAKLPALAEALRLNATAYQAVSFNLIEAPNPIIGLPVPLPMPLPMPIGPNSPAAEETVSARP